MTDPGWTIADLEELSYGWKKIIAERDIRLMERIGPDVYFAVRRQNLDAQEQR